MKAYLKGYYGYQNFGDELLFLGLLNYLDQHYNIDELLVETRDPTRLAKRVAANQEFISPIQNKLKYTAISKSKIAKLKDFFSNKYQEYHKFFGGGEVLSSERPFPHDGRNLYLGYKLRKKRAAGNYTLLGGVGKITNKRVSKLYKRLLPNAAQIILREQDSYQTVRHFLEQNNHPINDAKLILHEDFSLSILQQAQILFEDLSTPLAPALGVPVKGGLRGDNQHILINLNKASYNQESINKILEYYKNYQQTNKKIKAIFFPCDMQDDAKLFDALKNHIPKLELYDRTQHRLIDTLSLFYHAKAGIGARLHFLYPLKVFNIPYGPIVYKDKVRKLIIES